MNRGSRSLLAAVAATGLPTAVGPPEQPLPDARWSRLLQVVDDERLSGLLAGAIADDWPTSQAQVEAAAQVHMAQTAWVLRLERQLLHLAEVLDEAGVPHRVLKGSALAHLDYEDPAERCFVDIDVAVPASQFPRVCELLTEAGGQRRFPEPRPGFDVRFTKGASFHLPDGAEVDLHRTLVLGWFGLQLHADDLFSGFEPFELGGRTLHALSRPERLVHACIHASLGTSHPRWMPLRDVAQVVLGTEDVGPVLDRTRTWHCQVVVADAIRQAWKRLELTADHDLVRWAAEYPATASELRHLAAYRGTGRSHARMALDGVFAVGGWADRARYLHAILLPQRAPSRIPTSVRVRHGIDAIRAWGSR